MLTLAGPARYETTVRQSRFIVHAAPVAAPADTDAFRSAVADPGATHNCWAWRLADRYRFSDDGEPGGTAGRPILAAIDGRGLDRVMVVVTRYFGGIKLGTGGLARAYAGAASGCLLRAQVVTVHPICRAVIEADFEWTAPVHAAVEACAARRLGETFTPRGLRLKIELREDRLRDLERLLRDATRGTARLKRG